MKHCISPLAILLKAAGEGLFPEKVQRFLQRVWEGVMITICATFVHDVQGVELFLHGV